jgi:hypothetical protein
LSENKWAQAAQATTQEEADRLFNELHREMCSVEPYTDMDALKERVVSNIIWMSKYYGQDVSKRAGRLYANKSPYRSGYVR